MAKDVAMFPQKTLTNTKRKQNKVHSGTKEQKVLTLNQNITPTGIYLKENSIIGIQTPLGFIYCIMN